MFRFAIPAVAALGLIAVAAQSEAPVGNGRIPLENNLE